MDVAGALLELQETDLAIMRATKRLDQMPEKRAILEVRAKRREIMALRAKAEGLRARLERDVARSEDECSQISDKITAEQGKIMSGDITNPKELQHITREMDALKRRRDKIEVDEVAVMERVEKAAGQVAKVDQALDQLDKKEAEFTERFKEKGGQLQSDIERMKVERAQAAASLPADVLVRYEKVREAKQGVAVGRLDKDTCSACHMELPMERVQELRGGPVVGSCPACRRMLVIVVDEG
jgi:hypothetical protein